MKNKYIQVVTTISSKAGAEKIAKALIKGRLAACVQIAGPIKSIYRWKGKIETAKEWVCVIKTKKSLYKKVETAIKKPHPYEIPEIIAVPIAAANKDYLKWIKLNSG
ncbi:MAG: cytochrome C biogenesis protein CcdA [Candidatus Omnitrophica bacterium CG02_land_8_20_14_3_00__42_8]|nr:MAG: cytochrome C biogenesis protein CcdA [Candidatus Omnitrophica bacterium CG02_land_8_20_14_3_00__42_8]